MTPIIHIGESCHQCLLEGVVPARPAEVGSGVCAAHRLRAAAMGVGFERELAAWMKGR